MKYFPLDKKWTFFFLLWAFFLSGFFSHFFGTPGVLQAIELQRLLQTQKKNWNQIQAEIIQLESEIQDFKSNPFTQQREIRKVLGYIAQDEIIFDFSNYL